MQGPSHLLLSKPVIAAVSGYAVAGGLELSLMCDMRVAEDNAVFGVFCRRFGKTWCAIVISFLHLGQCRSSIIGWWYCEAACSHWTFTSYGYDSNRETSQGTRSFGDG